MNKERYALIKNSFYDYETSQCLNYGIKDLARVVIELNNLNECCDNLQTELDTANKRIEKLEEINNEWEMLNNKTLSGELMPAIVCKKYEEYENKIKDLESKLENYSVMNLNGLLADCIIENTENCFDSNVLNLLEKIAIDFSNKLKELKGGESDVKD